MKLKKILTTSLVLLVSLFLVSCGKTTPTTNPVSTTTKSGGNVTTTTGSGSTDDDTFEDKWIDGIPAIFDESMGYSDENPSAFQVGATRYVYYTRNVSKRSTETEIVVRKGTLKGGKWTYSDFSVCITPTDGSWDSVHVYDADVVKGTFKYGNEDYTYLMSYSGNSRTLDKKDSSIGLAVSNDPMGPWVKVGNKPFLAFNSEEYDSTGLLLYTGYIESSLISYDKKGKVLFFYEAFETFKSNRVMEVDFSNLDNPEIYSNRVVETSGVRDLGISNPLLYGCDYVLDTETNELIAARETATTITSDPKLADEIQIMKAPLSVITYHKGEWTGREEFVDEIWEVIGDKITCDDTALYSENKLGYTRIFSPTIVGDAYGHLIELESNFGTEGTFGAENTSGRQDGERFEDVIMLEGMEETVKYEHVKNETIGIEMDYDYESFTRQSGSASEVFISVYDNSDTPENYLELIYTTEDADSAAASIAESLSRNFNINKESRMLAKAGSCTCIDASATKDNQTPDQMQAVYVIPLSNGSVIATMHYSFEAAEGFGRRFSEMLNTLSIIR